MASTKYLKGECAHCSGHIEFPAEATGMPADCPHCGKTTELMLARPPDEPTVPRRIILWTLIAVLLLGSGFGAALYALKRAERWAQRKKEETAAIPAPPVNPETNSLPAPDDPFAKAEFRISVINLEKNTNSTLIHAVGTLENLSVRTRYGVKLEFDVLNADGNKIGTASDYQGTIEPGATWKFGAPVVNAKAANAKATAISEQQ